MKKWAVEFKDKNGEFVNFTSNLKEVVAVIGALERLGVDYSVFHKGEKIEKYE